MIVGLDDRHKSPKRMDRLVFSNAISLEDKLKTLGFVAGQASEFY